MMVVFVLFVFGLILGSPHGFQVLDQTQGGERSDGGSQECYLSGQKAHNNKDRVMTQGQPTRLKSKDSAVKKRPNGNLLLTSFLHGNFVQNPERSTKYHAQHPIKPRTELNLCALTLTNPALVWARLVTTQCLLDTHTHRLLKNACVRSHLTLTQRNC